MMTMMMTTVRVTVTEGTNLPACGWVSMNKYQNWDFSVRDKTKNFGSRKYFYPLFHFVQQLNEKRKDGGGKGRNGRRKKGDEECRGREERKIEQRSRGWTERAGSWWGQRIRNSEAEKVPPPTTTHTYTFSHHSIHFQVYNKIVLFWIKRWPPPH